MFWYFYPFFFIYLFYLNVQISLGWLKEIQITCAGCAGSWLTIESSSGHLPQMWRRPFSYRSREPGNGPFISIVNNICDGCVVLRWAAFRALVLCMLDVAAAQSWTVTNVGHTRAFLLWPVKMSAVRIVHDTPESCCASPRCAEGLTFTHYQTETLLRGFCFLMFFQIVGSFISLVEWVLQKLLLTLLPASELLLVLSVQEFCSPDSSSAVGI